MPPEVRAELESQKNEAKAIYNENEMRKSFANMNVKMSAQVVDTMTKEEEIKVNAAAMIKANGDKQKAFNKEKLLSDPSEVM